jgi:hypothetical protein
MVRYYDSISLCSPSTDKSYFAGTSEVPSSTISFVNNNGLGKRPECRSDTQTRPKRDRDHSFFFPSRLVHPQHDGRSRGAPLNRTKMKESTMNKIRSGRDVCAILMERGPAYHSYMAQHVVEKRHAHGVEREGRGLQRLSDCPRSVCVMSSRADEARLSTNISVHTQGRNKIRKLA